MNAENLNKANETLNKLRDSDVRIVYVPPMTVASAYPLEGEKKANMYMSEKFVRETGLLKIKPDARGMAAHNFSKEELKDEHSVREKEYEVWASIPDDMEVPAPLAKKTFEGGLYAAHLLRNGIEDLFFLTDWINASEKYELDDERPLFVELLNYYNWMPNYEEGAKRDDSQTDLLIPIKKINT